jgi:hypothetical protein
MAHSHLHIDLLAKACTSTTSSIQANVAPITTDVIASSCARSTFPANDARIDHDRSSNLEAAVSWIVFGQSGDATSKLMAESNWDMVSCDAMGFLRRIDGHGPCQSQIHPPES